MTVTLPPLTEREFQKQVTDLATLLGWEFAHFRPAQTSKGWRTPVSGTLGAGFPDLVLVRGRRLLFVELKTDTGKVTPEQARVQQVLAEAAPMAVHVWRPSDFDAIAKGLR